VSAKTKAYPASLNVDYPKKLDRLTTFFRAFWALPIAIVLSILSSSGSGEFTNDAGKVFTADSGGIASGLFLATALMIVFRQRYPKWWFDFALEFNRFSARVGAYLFFLTDLYPSTVDEQSVHLDVKYPDVKKDLNRWMPLVKWLLAIPHYVILLFLYVAVFFASIAAWFAILFTGSYPKSLFDFVVGVGRWSLRVEAYAGLLVTDEYPPFSLK
jgi:hypothetical protein